ncbi:type II toxin-antitoxin system PemK/MazF family toxin [Amphibiibacter pelophylacis]|uniref:Type II toxin-antitoxin system PemK/MazF family toxin n=1 Tax=Amphibiibacter pelophylacis TaxID=1799477 RepID=A0ACC6P0G2_9BURK
MSPAAVPAPRRGDIYVIDFDPPKGEEYKVGSEIMKQRPAVVLSRDAINRVRRTVMVVPLSSSQLPAPVFAVPVPSAGPDSVAVCDQITTVNKATRVIRRIGTLSSDDLRQIERAVMDALALP